MNDMFETCDFNLFFFFTQNVHADFLFQTRDTYLCCKTYCSHASFN